jgi:hypothetical protein
LKRKELEDSIARQKLGCQVMSRLFDSIVKPLATPETPGAFLGGLRVMAVDGTVLDMPDSQDNAKVFGYPGSRKGTRAAFPKVRVVLLIEAGTHLITDALMCPYRIAERVRALKLLRSVAESMLLMWDHWSQVKEIRKKVTLKFWFELSNTRLRRMEKLKLTV